MSRSRLDAIAVDNMETEHKRRAMLRSWFDNQMECCWETVVKVLVNMGRTKLAKEIADKYECEWTQS